MALHTVMFYWSLLALALVAACFIALLTRGGPLREEETAEAPKALFDFSGGREEGRRMRAALQEALAASSTDEEFERHFRLVVRSATGLDTELTWTLLGRSLMEYRRAGEFAPASRLLAERFLHDIPRRYRLGAETVTP